MLNDFSLWLADLPRWFLFMLTLPFVIALVSLMRLAVEERNRE